MHFHQPGTGTNLAQPVDMAKYRLRTTGLVPIGQQHAIQQPASEGQVTRRVEFDNLIKAGRDDVLYCGTNVP